MISLKFDPLPVNHVVVFFEGCEHSEQLELSSIPLLFLLGGLSGEVRNNSLFSVNRLIEVSADAAFGAVGADRDGVAHS